MRPLRAIAASCIASWSFVAGQAAAEPVYGIAQIGNLTALVSFDSATPGAMSIVAPIGGLVSSQTLRSIDFNPYDGRLYAVSSNGTTAAQLYTVNLATGALTTVGSGFSLTGNSGHGFLDATVSIDFNPVSGGLRVVTGSGQNYRVNAASGALIATDTALSDPFADMTGLAYSNNVAGASSTTLYAYNFTTDEVDTIGSVGGTPQSPNGGQVFVVGASGALSNSTGGLDISGVTGIAYASLFDAFGPGTDGFYTVDLATGAITLIGAEGFALSDFAVRVAVVPEPESLALFGLGAVALALSARRRSTRSA